MNIAHFFTILRIFIIPLFPLFYLKYQWLGIPAIYLPYILLVILVLCELTDIIDGFLARRKNQVTDLGKVLDPMADSITRIIVFFTYTQGWIAAPLLLVFVFLYREFIITTLRTVCAFEGFALGARKSGKTKAIIQAAVNIFIVVLMIPFTLGTLSLHTLRFISISAIAFAAFFSAMTAVEYIYAHRDYLKKILSGGGDKS